MRKIVAVILVLCLVFAFAAGCAKESTKKIASRPVQAKQSGAPPEIVTSQPAPAASAEVQQVEAPVQSAPATSPGEFGCEQLAESDLTEVLGGTWAKTDDCPAHPAMPPGVKVCMCSYDGPKQVYVNVEVQLYDDDAEALRVYNMYCDPDSESANVGTKSCVREKTSTLSPNYVFFYTPSHFVKVSCLGGSCPFGALTQLAGTVDSRI